ncbi:MAG: glycosyltransferase, partial [Verrucomicrobiae bacterium]|nr:glycosyltransferase [Verrucomicrobiae bacterium]
EWIVNHGKDDDRFRGVLFENNCGQSAALEAGFKSARYSVVGTLDADLQNDPFDFGILLEQLKDNIGVVCGIRVNRHDSKSKKFASRVANWVRNKLTNESITDTGCSLKIYRKEVLEKIKLFTGMHRFLPTLIKMEGYQAVEVPVGHHPRYAGTSKYSTFKRGWTAFFDLLAVRWMQKRKFHYRLKEHTDDNSNHAGSFDERSHRSSD